MIHRLLFPTRFNFIFLFFLLVFINSTTAQYIILQGKVVNEKNEPLEYVSVSIVETKKYTISDSKGNFQLVAPFQDMSIRFFYIGYKDTIIKIKQAQFAQLKSLIFNINVKLQQISFELKEIVIGADKKQVIEINPYKAFYLVDYELIKGNYILQLLSENILLLIDKNDSVVYKEKLNFSADTIYKDCMDNFYVLNKDSAYQFILGLPNFFWFKPISTAFVKKIMNPCKAVMDTNYFFGKYYNNGQSVLYWITGKDNKKMDIKIIDNTQMFKNIETAKIELAIYKGNYVKPTYENSGTVAAANFFMQTATPREKSIRILSSQAQLDHNLQIKVYYPLKRIRDSIYIFNHLSDSIHVFDKNGIYVRGTKLFYHLNKDGTTEIIVNEEGTEAYVKYQNEGIITLNQIELATGRIIRNAKLKEHHFIKKIKIKNNFVYYMYKEHGGENTSNELFKQFLEWGKE